METKDKTQVLNDSNPWKGLNFYKEGEVLYGRDEEIQSLTLYVTNNIQTVLYGKSGIGKSSIINAGVFPLARKEGLFPIPIRLKHDEDTSYIEQIKTAFFESGIGIKEILPAINEQEESLWEYLHRHTFFEKKSNEAVRPLIVLDQFEEFFTLQHNESKKKAFFSELADLLNEVTPNYIINNETKIRKENQPKSEALGFVLDLGQNETENKVEYVKDSLFNIVFTIREDFLSYLERYTKFIPVMKSNRYALLPLNEEQAKDVIMKPIPGLVDVNVARLIIQKVTGNTDFNLEDTPEIDVDAAVLSLYLSRLYIKKGDRENIITAELVDQSSRDIIKDFYEESVADLPSTEIEKIEDQLLTYDGRRNNVSRNDLISEGVSNTVINTLVEDKKLLRQFSYQDDIRVEFMHDILCPIVNERIEDREEEKKKTEERRLQEEQQRKLLAEEQRKREQIEAQAKADRERMEEEAKEQKRKNKVRLIVAFSLLTLGAIIWFIWYFFTSWEFTQNYASYTTENGWPVGVGKKVKVSDHEQVPAYYQLVKRGYNNKNTQVRIVNWNKELVNNVFEESPLVSLFEDEDNDEAARSFSLMQQQTSFWIFIPDNVGRVQRKTAFSQSGDELYSNSLNDSVTQIWANYIDKDGKSMRVRDNGADRMRIINKNGAVSECKFFSELGVPQSNYEGIYGYKYAYDENGRIFRIDAVDEFGEDVYERSVVYMDFDDYGRWTHSSDGNASYNLNSIVIERKNQIDSLLFNNYGTLKYRSEAFKDGNFYSYQYDNNQVKSYSHYVSETGEKKLFYQKRTLPQSDQNVFKTLFYYSDSLLPYRVEIKELKERGFTISYFGGRNIKDIAEPVSIFSSIGKYHAMTIDTTFENGQVKVTTKYFDESGGLNSTCRFNQDIAYYNESQEKEKHIVKYNDSVCYAYKYEFENGLVVAQSVLGINGEAIRYPQWDQNNLCYYKMKLIYDFSKTQVAIKGINEFGEESLITILDEEYVRRTVPSKNMSNREKETETCGIQSYQELIKPINKNNRVDYIHINDTTGTWYKAGIRDGDLLVSVGDPIIIARPNVERNTYDFDTIPSLEEPIGAQYYPVYFNVKEMNRYNNSTKQINK